MNIIDIHTHPVRTTEAGAILSVRDSADLMLCHMDRGSVAMSGLLGYDVAPFQSMEAVSTVNNFTCSLIEEERERFFGLCFINPALPESYVADELDRCLEKPEFRGIKLELDVNCRSQRLDLVMEKAIKYQVPVLHHSWYINLWQNGSNRWQENRSEPHDIADLARRFPSVDIIMAHLEGSNIRGILDVAELENVWIDTSGSQPFSGTLEFAVKEIGSHRILFGSDLFLRGLASQLGRILGSSLRQADLEAILFQNAQRLFGLSIPQEMTQTPHS